MLVSGVEEVVASCFDVNIVKLHQRKRDSSRKVSNTACATAWKAMPAVTMCPVCRVRYHCRSRELPGESLGRKDKLEHDSMDLIPPEFQCISRNLDREVLFDL